MAALVLALAACAPVRPPPPPSRGAPDLLAAVCFYRAWHVGGAAPPTGLLCSRDGGRSFEPIAWRQLIASSAAVGPCGLRIALACGNGVLLSGDGGRSWTLTGGWEMTEVQRVLLDARDPRRAWAASAYGLWRAEDLGAARPWTRVAGGEGFANDVIQDRTDPDRLWVGTEEGILRSEDGGGSFHRVGPPLRVRRIAQDLRDPRRLRATCDGRGLLESRDRGGRWSPVAGTPDVVFSVTQDPDRPERLFLGARGAVAPSGDGGRSWTVRGAGIPEGFLVLDVLADPTDPDRLVASGSDGLLESLDAGATWRRLGLEGALVPDLEWARLAVVPRHGPSREPGRLPLATKDPGPAGIRRPEPPGFAERARGLREALGSRSPGGFSWFHALLEAAEGRATEELWAAVRERLAAPESSMFFSLPAMAFYLHLRGRLPAGLDAAFREALTRHTIYRGDTENHWAMHYAALLLAAEAWPETSAAEWYMGRSTEEIHEEARGWLLHWAELTARRGQGEFDSPRYLPMFLTPLLLLHDFAAEPGIRRTAEKLLDLLLADYLAESLGGAWCGGHSRDPDVEEPRGAAAAYHHLYAGGIPLPDRIDAWTAVAALSSYRPPELLSEVANRRSTPYVHTEVKRVRNVIRFGRERNPPVHKYTYMTRLYGLGSLQGGLLQPVQQHTWDVTWKGSAPNATFFTVNPHVSARELGMFFPEELHHLVESVGAQKSGYGSPDKLVSSSPHEKIFQRENVLLALYQVPAGGVFPHVNLHVPDCLETSADGDWSFGRDGEFSLAWHASAPGEWEARPGHRLARLPAGHLGFVAVAAPPGVPFETFRREILACGPPALEGRGDALTLSFRPPDGPLLSRRWGEPWGRIDGEPAPFPGGRLFDGPFLRSDVGSGVITLTDGSGTLVLDFNDLPEGAGSRR